MGLNVLVYCAAKLPAFFQNFYNSASSKGLETKLTSENAFMVDLYALGGEKKPQYDERMLFWGCLCCFDLSLNP